ncbi:MAG: hypothetical protein ABID71_06585 [Chloroflexota bacterium]
MIAKNIWFIIGSVLAIACIAFVILGGIHTVQATREGNATIFYGAFLIEIVFFGGTCGLLSYLSFKKTTTNEC